MNDENFKTDTSAPINSLNTAVIRNSMLSKFEVENIKKARVMVNMRAVFLFLELWFLRFFSTILSDFKDFL